MHRNKSIRESSIELNIKLSTAKLIIRRFRKNGTIFIKKMKDGEEWGLRRRQDGISE